MQDTSTSDTSNPQAVDSTPLPLRNDTLLGVCHAIGGELGVSPTWFRLIFAGLLFVDPVPVIVAYLALGVVVGLVRWLVPDARPVDQTLAVSVTQAPRMPEAANESNDDHSLPVAA